MVWNEIWMRLLRGLIVAAIAGSIGFGIGFFMAGDSVWLMTAILGGFGFFFGLLFKLRVA